MGTANASQSVTSGSATFPKPQGIAIDLGCGSNKKANTIGLDVLRVPGVDHVLDLEKEALPFEDRSVAYAHSAHFFEHTANPPRIFAEVGRVCNDGARLEFWTPYGGTGSVFIYDHKTFFVEDHYLHMCVLYPEFWGPILKGRWLLQELQYVVTPQVLSQLHEKDLSLDFAIRYLRNVVTEFCAHIVVRRDLPYNHPSPALQRTFSLGRFEPRFLVKPTESDDYDQAKVAAALGVFSAGQAAPLA